MEEHQGEESGGWDGIVVDMLTDFRRRDQAAIFLGVSNIVG